MLSCLPNTWLQSFLHLHWRTENNFIKKCPKQKVYVILYPQIHMDKYHKLQTAPTLLSDTKDISYYMKFRLIKSIKRYSDWESSFELPL